MGGLSKKAYQIEKMRKGDRPVLVVDGGGLLFKSIAITPELAPQEKATASGIAEAYRLMRYDAVGITAQDLAAGLPFLQDLAKQKKVPWLSADLVDRASGKPLFPAHRLGKVGELSVGLFALAGPTAKAALRSEDPAMIQPWQEVIPRTLAQLKGADCIILLSGLPPAENEAVARSYPGIHLILQAGDDGAGNQPPQLVNNTLILQTEKQGKSMGLLDVHWNASKRWGTDRAKVLSAKRTELDRVQWFLRSHQRKGDPLVLYRNDPGKLKIYQELVVQEGELQGEIKRLSGEIAKGIGQASAQAENRFLGLGADLPDQPAVLAIVEHTTRAVNALGQELAKKQLARSKKEKTESGPLVGWQRCATCHRTEADFWRQSRHARAYETLRAKEQHFNPGCLPCHVTGPASTTLAEDLRAVSCESCHGPGREHSNDPSRAMVKMPPAQSCLGCHTPEHDDNFDYSRDLRRLNCIHTQHKKGVPP